LRAGWAEGLVDDGELEGGGRTGGRGERELWSSPRWK
jgi:hypothetical protein